jgi:hypothetical protein
MDKVFIISRASFPAPCVDVIWKNRKNMDFRIREAQIQILAPPLIRNMTWNKLFHLSGCFFISLSTWLQGLENKEMLTKKIMLLSIAKAVFQLHTRVSLLWTSMDLHGAMAIRVVDS